MKYSLKSQARNGLVMLAFGSLLGPVMAQQPDTRTNTSNPQTTAPRNQGVLPNTSVDTIVPPATTRTNPNNRTLPNTGNPADTMRTSRTFPAEGRTRNDGMNRNQRSYPNQGSRRDSMNQGALNKEGKMMPPNQGSLDSMNQRIAPHNDRGTLRDSMNRAMPAEQGSTPAPRRQSTTTPSQGTTRPQTITRDSAKYLHKPNLNTARKSTKAKVATGKKAYYKSTTKIKRKSAAKRGTQGTRSRNMQGTRTRTLPAGTTPSGTRPGGGGK